MEFATLSNGVKMPMIGYGMANNTGDSAVTAVRDAILAGYRAIDTAVIYDNEAEVGRGVQVSGVAREALFLTTKVWVQDMTFEKASASVERSLELLGTNYLDLVLLHQPVGDVWGAWRALEALYQAGKIKAIGVSNFAPALVAQLHALAAVPPMLIQLENHPFRNQAESVTYFQSLGMVVEAWAPFAEGMHDLFQDARLTALADKYGKDVGQIILRWQFQRGIVTIPKSLKPARMSSNLAIFDFSLNDEEMTIMTQMNTDETLFGVSEFPTVERIDKLLAWRVDH
jgi:diketogulonate reductase-like aldo/keto reductase